MSENLKYATELLKKENYTLVLYDGENLITSKDLGVKPVLDLYNQGKKFTGFSSADLIMGKAVAFLYVLLGIKEVYAPIVSEPAKEVLDKYDIKIEYDKKIPLIPNRDKTGFCPMEQAVLTETEPEKAYEIIQKKYLELN